MKVLRILLCIAISAVFASQTIGCRKRNKPDPSAVTPSEPPATAAAPAAVPDQPPASLPTGDGTAFAPSAAGEPGKEAVKTQDRFNRNTTWISKLSGNNPQLRAQVLAEIQKAGLSPVELQEFRKQAQMYGVKL